MVVDEEGKEIPEGQFSEREAFWRFGKEVYSLKDFEQWRLPGHGSARTGRNVIKGHEKECAIIHKASKRVGDRTHTLLQVLDGDIYCMDDIVSCYRYRTQSGNDNFMALQNNKNLKAEEFLMLCKLEKWAWETKRVSVDLSKVKKDRVAAIVVLLMMNPSKQNLSVVFQIIKNSEKPMIIVKKETKDNQVHEKKTNENTTIQNVEDLVSIEEKLKKEFINRILREMEKKLNKIL
jgi:hypothetical protein